MVKLGQITFSLNLTLKVQVRHSRNDLVHKQSTLYFSATFGYFSSNGGWQLGRTSLGLTHEHTDTQTQGHICTQTDAGNDYSRWQNSGKWVHDLVELWFDLLGTNSPFGRCDPVLLSSHILRYFAPKLNSNPGSRFYWIKKDIVRLSVSLSVRHTFLTMFPSSYHHEIFRSHYQWQRWRPCKSAKDQGQRSKVKVTEVTTQLNRFRIVTPVWIHSWWWTDKYSLMLLKRGVCCFSRSSVKFQGHTVIKIVEFDPDWAFPDYNSSLNSPMATK